MIIMNEKDEKIIYHGIWVKNQLKKGIIYYPNINAKYKGEIKNFVKNVAFFSFMLYTHLIRERTV